MTEVAVAKPRTPLFTVKSLAAFLDCTPRTVYNLLADGAFPSIDIPHVGRRIKAADVDKWLEAQGG